ncbi:MAG: hypothetical protein GY791_10025 [Alphaproteobacteria bacterium]|nr:hypothetical protein [Alphaproteobacteria bacterium]
MIAAPVELFVLVLVAALFVGAAVSDLRYFRIPNRIPVSLLVLYPAYLLAIPVAPDWAQIGFAVGCAVVVFVIGFVMFSMGGMGGGDVKLLTVSALWAGPAAMLPFLIVVAVSSLVLAVALGLRSSLEQSVPLREAVSGLRFTPLMKMTVPYGAAIATGGLFAVGWLAFG